MYFNQKGQIDNTLATQIYMHMDKSADGRITEDEFIRVWIKSEGSLKDKLRSKEQEIYAGQAALSENVSFNLRQQV